MYPFSDSYLTQLVSGCSIIAAQDSAGSRYSRMLDSSACSCSAIPTELYLDHGVGHTRVPEFSIACSGQVRVAPIGPIRSFLPCSASVRRSSGLCSWILHPQIRRTSAHPDRPLASGDFLAMVVQMYTVSDQSAVTHACMTYHKTVAMADLLSNRSATCRYR
jgi:hypothetical protein